MFTVVQFFEKQQLRVLAVPVSWVRDGCLMWPKLPSNEKLDKLRTGGTEFHGSTKKIPAIMGRKYKSLQAAEAAAEDLLMQEVSDIEAKRKLLKHRKDSLVESRPLKDYNKIIQEISSTKMPAHLGSDELAQKRQNSDTPVSQFRQSPPQDCGSGATSSQSHVPQHQRQILRTQKGEPPRHSLQGKSSETQPMELNCPNFTATIPAGNPLEPSRHLNTSNVVLPHKLQFLPKPRNEEGQANPKDVTSTAILELPQDQQQMQSIFVTDDNIIYINPQTNDSGTVGGSGILVDSFDEIKNMMTSLKFEMAMLGTEVATMRTDVNDMRNEMTLMKQDIIEAMNTSVRHVVEECFEKSFPQFATMLDLDRRDQSAPQEGKSVEEHKHINDEDDLINFNKMLASKQIKYFTKIIPPTTYYEKGDSACYVIVDCLFTRSFWNNFTWTGVNRGNKSKRGFREFANVLQLLLAIVSVGDPTYTSMKLESFCKNRLFRYSKARSCSKQLRKPTCRRTRVKEGAANGDAVDAVADDEENSDGPMDNMTTDSKPDDSDDDSCEDIDVKSHVEILMNSDEDLL